MHSVWVPARRTRLWKASFRSTPACPKRGHIQGHFSGRELIPMCRYLTQRSPLLRGTLAIRAGHGRSCMGRAAGAVCIYVTRISIMESRNTQVCRPFRAIGAPSCRSRKREMRYRLCRCGRYFELESSLCGVRQWISK
jgi:hypothetical protein